MLRGLNYILVISVLSACSVNETILDEKDFYGFWNLGNYNTTEEVEFLSTILHLDKNNYCNLPTRVGYYNRNIGSFNLSKVGDSFYLNIKSEDPFFNGKWIVAKIKYSDVPEFKNYIIRMKLCKDSLCLEYYR